MNFKHLKSLLCSLLVFTTFIKNAEAYIDPGTGSFFLQMLIASLLGALFAIKMFWGKIKDFFLKLFGKNKKSDE